MKDNYFEEIGQYLSQLQALDTLFQEWGYTPTIVPMLDAQSPYESIEGRQFSQFFSVLDADREPLLLRADSTLFLARAISKHLHKYMLPLRICYSNSVVRPSKELIHELWQSGIELIGVSGIEGDLEIIKIVHSALDSIVPSLYRIHIGSRTIVEACIRHFNPELSTKKLHTIFNFLAQRNFEALASNTSVDCATLLLNIMDPQEFDSRKSDFMHYLDTSNTTLKSSFTNYCTLINTLTNIMGQDAIRCDFSEIGSHKYYTNIVFSAYAQGQPSAVAQGGRYDNLLQHFGVTESAIGATIFPHLLRDYIISRIANKANKTSTKTTISKHPNSSQFTKTKLNKNKKTNI